MSSILSDPSTRIFCISGELSDVFCLGNGWLLNFDELLSLRLRSLGYSGVVFCSTQRNMLYAVDPAGAEAMESLSGKRKKPDPEPVKPAPVQDDYSFLDDEPAVKKEPEKKPEAPAPGKKIEMPAKKVVKFKAGAELAKKV